MEAPAEFWLGAVTFLGVILVDVLQGMIIGLLCSIVLVIYRSSRPHLASLGHVPEVPGAYSDLERHPENVAVPGVLIVRLDAPLYYANALTVRDGIKAMIEDSAAPVRAVVIEAAVQYELDLTSADMLKSLVKELHDKGITVYVADMHAPVAEFARRTELLDLIGEQNIFATADLAVRFAETSSQVEASKA